MHTNFENYLTDNVNTQNSTCAKTVLKSGHATGLQMPHGRVFRGEFERNIFSPNTLNSFCISTVPYFKKFFIS